MLMKTRGPRLVVMILSGYLCWKSWLVSSSGINMFCHFGAMNRSLAVRCWWKDPAGSLVRPQGASQWKLHGQMGATWGTLDELRTFWTVERYEELAWMQTYSRRFIGMFSFAQSYKSKWFLEHFSMLIEAVWCFLLALPGWLVSLCVCVTLSLYLSFLFLSFSLHSLNASQEFKFKLPHGTCRSAVVRHMTGAETGIWQHGMNPVTFFDFTSWERQDGYFSSLQIKSVVMTAVK